MTTHKTEKKIHLIRHGQARAGTTDYDRLSPVGKQQAAVLGHSMAKLGLKPGDIWSGSLKRQRQTALLAHPNIAPPDDPVLNGKTDQLRVHTGLNEYDHRTIHPYHHPDQTIESPGDGTDLPTGMTLETYTHIIQNWATHSGNNQPVEVESWQQFNQRAMAAVTDAAEQSDSDQIALYSSGAVISAIVARVNKLSIDEIVALIWQMNNASITTLAYSGNQLKLVEINNIDHLSSHGDKELITWI